MIRPVDCNFGSTPPSPAVGEKQSPSERPPGVRVVAQPEVTNGHLPRSSRSSAAVLPPLFRSEVSPECASPDAVWRPDFRQPPCGLPHLESGSIVEGAGGDPGFDPFDGFCGEGKARRHLSSTEGRVIVVNIGLQDDQQQRVVGVASDDVLL